MSDNYNRNGTNYSEQQPRPPTTLNPYATPVQYQNMYYPSTVNSGNMAYVTDPQDYHPTVFQPPALQTFNDEVTSNEPDEFILDLLKKPQERLFLLKLELEFEALIKDNQQFRLDFPNMNSYQRLMIHKLAPYYKLNHFHDGMRKGVYVCKTDITELPETSLLNIDVSEKTEEPQQSSTPQPQFKIMRRSAGSGSVSPRSTGDDSKSNTDRKNMTLEERKTAYEEARARIFQGLEEK